VIASSFSPSGFVSCGRDRGRRRRTPNFIILSRSNRSAIPCRCLNSATHTAATTHCGGGKIPPSEQDSFELDRHKKSGGNRAKNPLGIFSPKGLCEMVKSGRQDSNHWNTAEREQFPTWAAGPEFSGLSDGFLVKNPGLRHIYPVQLALAVAPPLVTSWSPTGLERGGGRPEHCLAVWSRLATLICRVRCGPL
jgi:hypothetical protein